MDGNIENAIQETIEMQHLKNKLDNLSVFEDISDIVDSLSEEEAKKLLKMYIYA